MSFVVRGGFVTRDAVWGGCFSCLVVFVTFANVGDPCLFLRFFSGLA